MTGRPWRVLFSGKRTGAYNMALDASILQAVENNQSPPTLRIYGWNPYCVSLGYFQNPSVELDVVAMQSIGWDFVLRPTGGRAVLHAEEITYSLIARRDEVPWCSALPVSHARISRAWSLALSDFGLSVEAGEVLEKPQRGQVGLPCFASTSRSELAHAGRKVVGSAQRRTREAFLQHGSIPLTPAHERLVEVLRLNPDQREVHREALRRHAVSLGEIGSLPDDMDAWIRRCVPNFFHDLEVTGQEGLLSRDEGHRALEMEALHRERQRIVFEEITMSNPV